MTKISRSTASMMVFAALFATIVTFAAGSYLTVTISGSIGTERMAQQEQAYYAAEAGVYDLLYQTNATGATAASGSLTNTTHTAAYTASYANGLITSTGTVGNISRTVTVRTLVQPPYVKAAVTVNSSATTSGSITIDGRDHDANGNVTGPGTYGISAAGLINQSGSSRIGGNGIAPASPAAPGTYDQSVSPFPSTNPWDVLGVSQAWFTANVPVRITPPPEGFNGIYYYDPPGGTWNPANLEGMQGILIVHNATNTATMKNLHETFRGLIISDQITHINGDATINGAVITTNAVGNTLGNGNATVNYSSVVLNGLGVWVGGQTSAWKKNARTSSWREP